MTELTWPALVSAAKVTVTRRTRLLSGGNIVGICDVDANTLNGKDKSFKEMAEKASRTYDAKKYKDWRKMLDGDG